LEVQQHMKKTLVVAALLAMLGPAAATAQAPAVPEVSIGLGKSTVTLTGADNLQAGPTKITLTNPDRVKENFGGLFLLRAGVTPDEFRGAVQSRGIPALYSLGTLEYTAALAEADSTHSSVIPLQRSGTYVAIQGAGENPDNWAFASFTVGSGSNGATAPTPDATVDMDDFVFAGDRRLPRNGTIRFRNIGTAPHFAVAFPLKAKARFKGFKRAIMRNRERAAMRLVGGPPTEIQGLVSAGADNTTDIQFARRGRYALVCFFSTRENRQGHHEIGMVNQVRVR
jgi:hypothetical protein